MYIYLCVYLNPESETFSSGPVFKISRYGLSRISEVFVKDRFLNYPNLIYVGLYRSELKISIHNDIDIVILAALNYEISRVLEFRLVIFLT